MDKKTILILLLLLFVSTFVYASEASETTNQTEEKVIIKDVEKRDLYLDINIPIEKGTVYEEAQEDPTTKIAGFISYNSSIVTGLIFVFIFVFIVNIYINLKKKRK